VDRYPESRLAPLALLRQGQIQFKKDNIHDAVSFFSRIIEKYPGSHEALEARLQLAFCDHRLGLFDDSIQVLKGLLDEGLDPEKESLALYTIGEAFSRLNKHLDSVRWFIRAWKVIPDPLFREATGEMIKEICLTKLIDEELEKVANENKGAFPGDIATFQLSLILSLPR
jgi:tetratricopeptide (TPR) repeat protein